MLSVFKIAVRGYYNASRSQRIALVRKNNEIPLRKVRVRADHFV